MKRKRNEGARKFADQFLAEVIEFGQQPGNDLAIAEELNRLTGNRHLRQQVREWIRPVDRIEPKLGVGIAIMRAVQNLKKREAK